MVVFQAIAWNGRDEDSKYTVTVYGRTEKGDSVSLSCLFQPYFFVRASDPKQFAKYRAIAVKAKDLWGFQNSEKFPFIKLTFDSFSEMRKAVWQLQRRYKVYEANIDPLLRFMHRTGISSTGWIDTANMCIRSYNTTCTIDLFCQDWKSLRPVDRDDIAPLKIMSFDIECYSADGSFPDPDKPDNVVFQIGMTIKTFGQPNMTSRECLCLKNTTGYTSFETEKELLEAFAEYIRRADPDVITGWNIFGFDLEYLYKRLSIAKCLPEAYVWGRSKDVTVELVTKNLSSGALGNNVLKLVPMVGRYTFDLFHDVKREHKLESYSLNSVSKVFLNDQKIDMPPSEIFRRFAEGDPDKLGEVADYCIKDTLLPHAIMDKLCTFQNLTEMAKATWVPLSFLSERGQQIKVFSQMAKKARELGFMIPTIPYNSDQTEETYQGATVLDAQTGAYYSPVTALDFASLYPSIMCAHNLCYSTLVMDPKYDNLPGVTYEQYGPYRFAQNVPSLLPVILMELKQFRKKAKKDMAAVEGTQMEAVYNGKQLAYKISMNSVYGFTGATKGMLPCKAIASTVTMRGRQMIEETRNFVESNFPGAKVRYGDSVMPDTPVLIRQNLKTSICTIESLGDVWTEYGGFLKEGSDKQQSELSGLETWTHGGWKPIKRIIRHRCQKSIWRVLTHSGCVDVTEDHSLLDPNLKLLKPKDVSIGQKLCHSYPDDVCVSNLTCCYEEAFILGMFVGDGSCGLYDCPSGRKASWAINNQDLELLGKCKEYCEKVHPEYEFVIMDTLESSGVYKLSPRGGSIVNIVNMYRSMCYDNQAKKVPAKAFSAPGAFLDGLWSSDGCRKDHDNVGCHRIDTKNQVTAQWYFLLLRTLGYKVSINTRSDKPNIFRITWTLGSHRKDPYIVKKVHLLHKSWVGYVYDLETEAGTFQAGIGQLIVKNTDSVMVEFDVQGRKGQEAIDYSWVQGELAAEQCTKLFKAPNELELEKVYCPYFLYSKKRYAAKLYEKKGDAVVMKKVDIKGLQVVRRDNCPYVRQVCKSVLDHILNGSDPMPAIQEAKEGARRLLAGEVSTDQLVMSKQLAAEYKVKMAHVSVRDKIRERAPGSEPKQGDRVQFVIIDGPKKARMYEKAEDPKWVEDHSLPIDYNYYFLHQLKNPILDLLEPLIGSTDIFSDM
jgi:DNA polymerase delta subunit 1